MPFSVLPPISEYRLFEIICDCIKAPFLFEIGIVSKLSPNLPTYPSSEHWDVITLLKLSISAIVTLPYSEFIEPHALPELSDRHIVLPFNLGIFSIEISIHSSNASNILALKLTLEFSMFLYAV